MFSLMLIYRVIGYISYLPVHAVEGLITNVVKVPDVRVLGVLLKGDGVAVGHVDHAVALAFAEQCSDDSFVLRAQRESVIVVHYG
jgi:hypothetical protein